MKRLPPPRPVVVIYQGNPLTGEAVLNLQRDALMAGSTVVFCPLTVPDCVELGSFSHSMATSQSWPRTPHEGDMK